MTGLKKKMISIHTHTHIHTQTYTHTHTYTDTHIHTHTLTHTHTHSHTHTHTHTFHNMVDMHKYIPVGTLDLWLHHSVCMHIYYINKPVSLPVSVRVC